MKIIDILFEGVIKSGFVATAVIQTPTIPTAGGFLVSTVNADPSFNQVGTFNYQADPTGTNGVSAINQINDAVCSVIYDFRFSLEKATTYYIKSYAKIGSGAYEYSPVESITLAGDPVVSVQILDRGQSQYYYTAKLKGTTTAAGGTITERGFLWSQLADNVMKLSYQGGVVDANGYTEYGTYKVVDAATGNADFETLIDGLPASTNHYVRAYVRQEVGGLSEYFYSDILKLRTKPDPIKSSVTCLAYLSEDKSKIMFTARVFNTNDGGEDTQVYAKVYAYQTSIPDELPADAVLVGTHKAGSLSSTLTGGVNIVGIVGSNWLNAYYAYTVVIFAVNTAGVSSSKDILPLITIPTNQIIVESAPTGVSLSAVNTTAITVHEVLVPKSDLIFWKCEIINPNNSVNRLVPVSMTELGSYQAYGVVSDLAVNTAYKIRVTVRTSYTQNHGGDYVHETTLTTPLAWDLTDLYKPITPSFTKSTFNNSSKNLKVVATIPYAKGNIVAGAHGVIVLIPPGLSMADEGTEDFENQAISQSVVLANDQSLFEATFDLNKSGTWSILAQVVDKDGRVYRSYIAVHEVLFSDLDSRETFTISYNLNGGSGTAAQQSARSGDVIYLNSGYDLSRSGYTFAGWSEAGWVLLPAGSAFSVNKNTVLFAQWKANEYLATFFSNFGTVVPNQKIYHDGKVTKPADPTRSGYVFSGWYTEEGLLNTYNFNASVSGNVFLYAKWQAAANTTTYEVVFNSNGGSVVNSQTVISGARVSQPENPTKSGNTFFGWYTDQGLNTAYNFDTPVSGDVLLYAKWVANSGSGVENHIVSFNSNGGSAVSYQTIAGGGLAVNPANPTRSGYVFAGWYSNSTFSELFDFANTAIVSDIVLYAKWTLTSTEQVDISNLLPTNPVPGRKFTFGDRIWVWDETDQAWRRDYMTEIGIKFESINKPQSNAPSSFNADLKNEIEQLKAILGLAIQEQSKKTPEWNEIAHWNLESNSSNEIHVTSDCTDIAFEMVHGDNRTIAYCKRKLDKRLLVEYVDIIFKDILNDGQFNLTVMKIDNEVDADSYKITFDETYVFGSGSMSSDEYFVRIFAKY